ncbi:cytidylate kinase-like family protein [Pectinatus sottacetonis]|uniref:cytidylate kinase-like family protein n=1 Tax=Pectinatus sottacetonis TaxID=1002795 RepID=UPI0018C69789|nr:cytidylate kinase-like family protein [Pectinatus sottacetonis]
MDKNSLIITISRQYGSGGREVAQKLADKLDIALLDRKIINTAAQKLGAQDLPKGFLDSLEHHVNAGYEFIPFVPFGTNIMPSSTDMFFAEVKVIYELVKQGPCVILGRSADVILKNYPHKYSFFICADKNFRQQRGKTVYNGKTFAELENEDKKRAEYYYRFTGHTWGRGDNYDLSINTSKIGTDGAVNIIMKYIENVKKL